MAWAAGGQRWRRQSGHGCDGGAGGVLKEREDFIVKSAIVLRNTRRPDSRKIVTRAISRVYSGIARLPDDPFDGDASVND